MDYLKILHENPDLADEFDSLFDFFLLDELFPRNDAEGRCTFSLPGMAFARDGSGGEYPCWKMVPLDITAAKGRLAVWLRAWMISFPCL